MILALPARAKLNLELSVLGRRPDGYHEVETLLQSIELHDLVEAEPAGRASLEVTGLEAPLGETNLVLRALRAVEAETGRPLPTRFRLTKRIPGGAGFGGGSSDAASSLIAVSRLHGLELDLARLAAGLGMDIPFFLAGGAARARSRGELLQREPTAGSWYALAWPGFELATAAVYQAWDQVGGAGPNQLERAAFQVEPRLAEFAAELGPGWQMTGSGCAYFHRYADRAEATAATRRLSCWTAVTRSLSNP